MPNTEFRRRMEERLGRWYKGTDPGAAPAIQQRRQYIAGLVNKTSMFNYAKRMDLPLPERYAEAETVDQLDFATLPERVVIKPNNAANNDGVMLFDKGREIFSGDEVPVAARADYVRKKFSDASYMKANSKIIAEEFIQDYDESFVVPRDFKVFVAGGQAWVIQVVNRTGAKKQWSHRYYNQDWVPYDHFQRENAFGEAIPKPPHFDELIRLSNLIAQDIKVFMRLDFYIAKRGVIFGEFTSYPNAGLQFTEIGNAVLCGLLDRYPDPF